MSHTVHHPFPPFNLTYTRAFVYFNLLQVYVKRGVIGIFYFFCSVEYSKESNNPRLLNTLVANGRVAFVVFEINYHLGESV